MGQNCWADDVKNSAKAHTPSSDPRFPLSRGVLKSKGGGKLSIHFCADGETVETVFSAQWVPFTEQSQIGVKNVVLAMTEQGDLLWQDNLTHCPCHVWWRHTHFWPMIPAQEEDLWSIAMIPGRNWKSCHNKTEVLNFVLMQDSWPQLKSDNTSWQRTLKNSH